MPLLALITQRSLDADYEHVAARRRAAGEDPSVRHLPRRTAAMVLLVFGLLVTVAAVQTSRNASVRPGQPQQPDRPDQPASRALADLQAELAQEQTGSSPCSGR